MNIQLYHLFILLTGSNNQFPNNEFELIANQIVFENNDKNNQDLKSYLHWSKTLRETSDFYVVWTQIIKKKNPRRHKTTYEMSVLSLATLVITSVIIFY